MMEEGLKRIGLTVRISTKPNRSHVVHGKISLILPALGLTTSWNGKPWLMTTTSFRTTAAG